MSCKYEERREFALTIRGRDEIIECECGTRFFLSKFEKHRKTKVHKNYIKKYNILDFEYDDNGCIELEIDDCDICQPSIEKWLLSTSSNKKYNATLDKNYIRMSKNKCCIGCRAFTFDND